MFTTSESRWLVVALLLCAMGFSGWLASYERQALESKPTNSLLVVEKAKPQRAAAPRATEQALVDLNLASVEELIALPGVGPTLAQRIMEARHRLGRFETVQDLDLVPGIGPATLQRLLPLVVVSSD